MRVRQILSGASLLAMTLSLQSCFVARNYEQPKVIETDQFRTDRLPADSASMAEVSWREIFNDPILVSHIDKGLENNIDIRIAVEQLEIAEAYFKQTKAGYWPTFNINATTSHQQLSGNSQFGSFFNGGITQFELSGTLGWEADIWGRIRSNRRAGEAGYLQSVAAHKTVKTRLISSIASVYYQLLALDAQKAIIEETIANRSEGLEATKALREAGSLTEVAVQQTQAQLHSAQALLIDTETNIKLLENTFSLLLGQEPGIVDRSTLGDQVFNAEIRQGYPSQLLRNRPDVIAAEQGLVQAFELTNVARSQFYPTLSLSATGGLQSLDIDQLFNVNSLFANVVGNLMQPVFNRRAIQTQYDVSLSQKEIAYLSFRYTVINAGKEVSDALYAYEAAVGKLGWKEKEHESYEKAAEYSGLMLESGLATYLEVLTAQQAALMAELEVVNVEINQLSTLVELYRALGGGWR